MPLSQFILFIRWAEDFCLEMVGVFSKSDINIAYTHCIKTIQHVAYYSDLSQNDYAALCLEYGYSYERMKPFIF